MPNWLKVVAAAVLGALGSFALLQYMDGREIQKPQDGAIAITRGPGEGGWTRWVPGHLMTSKADAEETGGAYSLLEVLLTGEGPPQHIHKTEDEAFYVLEGELDVKRGEETLHASAGAFLMIPRGTIHTVWNTGSTPAKTLAIFSPPGFEEYFLDTGSEDREPDKAAYIEKAMAVSEKHNLEIVGPPLSSP